MLPQPLSTEFQLLCLCCTARSTAADGEAIRALAEGLDWPVFFTLVRRHRLAGLTFDALRAAGIRLDPAIAAPLAMAALKIRHENRLSAAETVRLQRALDAAGIEARFFKGAVLGQLAYGTIDLKHSKDIDVLVAPADAQALVAMLEREGYRLWQPVDRLAPAQWPGLLRFGKEVAMVKPGTSLQVEPHWRLTWNPRVLAYLDAAAPQQMVALPGHGEVRTFTREDMFTYLCVHGMEHAWFRLKWLADLRALLAPLSADAIEALYHYAERRGVGPSAAVALALAERLLSLSVPPALHSIVRGSRVLRRLERLSLKAMLDPSVTPRWRRHFDVNFHLAAVQGYLASQLALAWVSTIDVLAYPLPRWLHPLYPALRVPLGLARKLRGVSQADVPPMPAGPGPSTTRPPAT